VTATAAPAPVRDRLAPLRRWTPGVLLANVIGQVGIIVTGGAVRLTDSGLGCSTWPECHPGQFTAQYHAATSYHEIVEFTNRTLTGVLTVLGLLVLLLVWTDRARPAAYRRLGVAPLVGVLLQAVIGGVVVLLHLHPGWVSLHFGVSAGLVWVSAYLLRRSREGDGAPVLVASAAVRRTGWVLSALLVAVVAVGVIVTGAGPHSGDDTVGYRFAVDPLTVTRVHSGAVWLFVATLVALLVQLHRTPAAPAVAGARRAAWLLVVVTLLQGAIGYTQYFTGLPALLVGVHMLGAALLVWATANAVLHLRTRS
jgi:cytochrome c oxidase assembly protein subunit 15